MPTLASLAGAAAIADADLFYVEQGGVAVKGTGAQFTTYARSGISLNDLSDVDVGGSPGPSDGDVLTYDAGSPSGWVAAPPAAGSAIEVLDEGVSETAALVSLDFVGAGVTAADDGSGNVTVTIAGGGGAADPSPVETDATTNYDVADADEGAYIRLTNAGAKTVTVRPESTEALTANGEWHFRNVGAGDATITEGLGVTVHPPAGGTLVVPEGGTVTLKRVAEDEFDLIGVTVAA